MRNYKISDNINFVLSSFAEILSPRHCEVCDKPLGIESRRFEFICERCFNILPYAPTPDAVFNRLISNFPKDDLAISAAFSLFSVADDFSFMELIHSLKYSGFSRIGKEFGSELGHIIQNYGAADYDFLVPIPIHSARLRERGFNQSEVIASGLGAILQLPVNTKIVKRSVYTRTQTVLSKEERRKNVSNVFIPYNNSIKISGKKILLIDDVLTTGSTLNACANCLLEMGARRVDAATLAIA